MKVFIPRFNDNLDRGNFYVMDETPGGAKVKAEKFLKQLDEQEYIYFAGRGWALSEVQEMIILNGIILL